MIVVSPHLDDAVFSVGQVIGGCVGPVKVLTVFAGYPDPVVVTPFDESAGFAGSTDAVGARRLEDRDACQRLDANWSHKTMLDDQYRDGPVDRVELTQMLSHAPGDVILFPIGLGHPDHTAVADCCLAAIRTWKASQVWVYEELPYRVHRPDLVHERLTLLEDEGFNPQLQDLPQCGYAQKQEAVECYQSQLNEMTRRCVYVPERTWRIR